ncbi:cytochrome c family protein [Brevundimonas staleyi]|uniref:Cytochrome c family protein n=1 Tax=Brevundimonas staleyi TaxID=74326 RepID=A0ABW0FS42_9CAUL
MRTALAVALMSLCACADKTSAPRVIEGADATRGLAVLERVGCAACHQIPGVAWPQGSVGGSLDGFAERSLIAGRLPNQPDTLVQWLRDAPSLSPETGMPPMPITDAEARDVAAYLYTLR